MQVNRAIIQIWVMNGPSVISRLGGEGGKQGQPCTLRNTMDVFLMLTLTFTPNPNPSFVTLSLTRLTPLILSKKRVAKMA